MAAKNPAKYFIRKDVTNILTKVTGFDLNKIFRPGFNPLLKNSEIQLLTQKELDQENKKAIEKAKELLQMPPFLNPREKTTVVLSKDDKLNPLNLSKTKYMFLDISMDVPDNKRMIVVREPNGELRKADHDEREKMLQVYFPKKGKSNYIPQMFQPNQLEECLKLKNYLTVLNKACIKFEPNDPEFIRVTHRIYDYINEVKDYEVLRSTRFFGPMVFYLAWYKKLDNIIGYMLNNSNIDDCADIVKLYLILHENEAKTKKFLKQNESNIELIKLFIKNDLKNGASAELALTNYLEKLKDNDTKLKKQVNQ